MTPARRIVRTAVLLTAPALLTVRLARALAGRTRSAIRGSDEVPVPGPLFTPEPALAPVPIFEGRSAAAPSSGAKPKPTAAVVDEVPVYASELPIASYDALNVRDASTAIKALEDAEQVRLILRYEEENAKRTTVHKAARVHLESLEGKAGAAL